VEIGQIANRFAPLSIEFRVSFSRKRKIFGEISEPRTTESQNPAMHFTITRSEEVNQLGRDQKDEPVEKGSGRSKTDPKLNRTVYVRFRPQRRSEHVLWLPMSG
jgi:hypothetical protein